MESSKNMKYAFDTIDYWRTGNGRQVIFSAPPGKHSANLCGINVTYGGRAVRMEDGMRLMVDM